MDTATFFELHFGRLDDDHAIEVRGFHPDRTHPPAQRWFTDPREAAGYALSLEGYDTYFGVNLRRHGRGDKAGVTRLVCLHADVDFKVYDGDERAALNALTDFELEPGAIVRSGGGLHVYWYLREPLDATPEAVARAEGLMKRLYYRLGGLDEVQDVSRILRVPGTVNRKPGYADPHVRVVYSSAARHTLEDFARLLPELPPREDRRREADPDEEAPPVERLREMLAHVSPNLPYREWVGVVMAVKSAYPGQDGLDLIDEWSSEARVDEGQQSIHSGKFNWWKLKVRDITLGTLYHHATRGGWEPPRGPELVVVRRGAPVRVPEWQSELADPAVAPLAPDELPHHLRAIHDHLRPLTLAWGEDWTEMLAVSAFSLLFPRVRFENLNLALWFLGVAESGAGKTRSGKEVSELVELVAQKLDIDVSRFTSGTPQGLLAALDGDDKTLYAYHSEYSSFLSEINKSDYMGGMKTSLCDLYDGMGVERWRAKDHVAVKNPYVVVVATTTPREIVEHGRRADFQNGYLSRFLFCVPDSLDVDNGAYRTTAERLLLAQTLAAAIKAQSFTTARFDTPHALDPPCLIDYKARLRINTGRLRTFEDSLLEDEHMPPGRLVVRVKKVATLLELAEAEPRHDGATLLIREANVAKAIRLVRRGDAYCKRAAREMGGGQDVQTAERIVRAMRRLDGPATRRELLMRVKVGARDLAPALQLLQDEGTVEEIASGKTRKYRLVG